MDIQSKKEPAAKKDLFSLAGGMPFTRRGAWFGIYADNFMHAIYGTRLLIGSRRGSVIERGDSLLMRFSPMYGGEKVDYEIHATAAELTLTTAYGEIRCCFPEDDLLYIKGENGLSLRLERSNGPHEVMKKRGKGYVQLSSWIGTALYYPVTGSLEMKADWNYESLSTPLVCATVLPDDEGNFLLAVQESFYDTKLRDEYPGYEEGLRAVSADFEDFVSRMPKIGGEFAELLEEALYTEWALLVNPSGRMKYPLIFMTGRAMASSWQMIQNAVAFKDNIPLRNAMLLNMLPEQSPLGQLPDFYDDARSNAQGIKPPIQGWGLKWIMKDHDLFSEIPEPDLQYIYRGYAAWADWFTKYRDEDHDGLPEYEHGDECGFDDSSIFLNTPEAETPDLPAYLVLLYEALGDLAAYLKKPEEQAQWYRRSKDMLSLLIDELWDGEMFIARTARTHEPIRSGSLQHYVPLILGKRLPQEIIDKMTADLLEPGIFLSQYGLASERMDSDQYRIMGMARGFVLPPQNLLILTGMYDAGKTEEAKMIASRYCLAMKDNGFNMLIDPKKPGRSSFACSWPTCAFLILADMIQNK